MRAGRPMSLADLRRDRMHQLPSLSAQDRVKSARSVRRQAHSFRRTATAALGDIGVAQIDCGQRSGDRTSELPNKLLDNLRVSVVSARDGVQRCQAFAMAATWRWSVPQQPPMTCRFGSRSRSVT